MSREESARQVARELHDWLNRGADTTTLVEALHADHRTLQQELMRSVIWPLIQLWGEDWRTGRYDLRNEGTVKFCASILDKVEAPILTFI